MSICWMRVNDKRRSNFRNNKIEGNKDKRIEREGERYKFSNVNIHEHY